MDFAVLTPRGKQQLKTFLGRFASTLVISYSSKGLPEAWHWNRVLFITKSKRKSAQGQDAWYEGPGSGPGCEASLSCPPQVRSTVLTVCQG